MGFFLFFFKKHLINYISRCIIMLIKDKKKGLR
nr:MAG TPA: DVL family [Caudoviricetes sp.]